MDSSNYIEHFQLLRPIKFVTLVWEKVKQLRETSVYLKSEVGSTENMMDLNDMKYPSLPPIWFPFYIK
jgi:hypothetical protein